MTLVRILILVAGMGAWQLVSVTTPNARAFVSSPLDVLDVLGGWGFGPDPVWADLFATLRVAAVGLVVGCVAAVGAAFVLSQAGGLNRFLAPFVAAANVMPKVALIPLFVLWFGVADTSKVTFVAVLVFFIVFYNVFTSLLEAAEEQRDQLRVLGASRWWVTRELLLPTAWGSFISSMRVSVAFSLLGAVLTEMMASNSGLGFRLAYGQATLAPDIVVAAILIVAVIGVVLDIVLVGFDRRLAPWRAA